MADMCDVLKTNMKKLDNCRVDAFIERDAEDLIMKYIQMCDAKYATEQIREQERSYISFLAEYCSLSAYWFEIFNRFKSNMQKRCNDERLNEYIEDVWIRTLEGCPDMLSECIINYERMLFQLKTVPEEAMDRLDQYLGCLKGRKIPEEAYDCFAENDFYMYPGLRDAIFMRKIFSHMEGSKRRRLLWMQRALILHNNAEIMIEALKAGAYSKWIMKKAIEFAQENNAFRVLPVMLMFRLT